MQIRKALLSLAASALCLAATATHSDAAAIYSWENTHENFRIGQAADGAFVTVSQNVPGATDGTWAAEVATTATTNFYRGAFSADLANALKNNTELAVDFAIKDPELTTSRNVVFSIIVAGRNSDGTGFFSVELPAEERIRAFSGTATIDYGSLNPALTAGVGEARIEFRVVRQGGFTGSLYIDNLRVVPEPASLGLLVPLAGAALLRRRRNA